MARNAGAFRHTLQDNSQLLNKTSEASFPGTSENTPLPRHRCNTCAKSFHVPGTDVLAEHNRRLVAFSANLVLERVGGALVELSSLGLIWASLGTSLPTKEQTNPTQDRTNFKQA